MTLEELMNRSYGTLSENDRQICSYILQNKKHCSKLSIDELAAACHVSRTMIFRFAKKLSLSGFAELRARLRLEAEEGEVKNEELLKTVTDSYHKMIGQVGELDCSRIFRHLKESDRILVYGSGYAQARAASEFKRIFLPVRRKIYTMHGSDMAKPFQNMARPGDYVVLLSLSGENEDIIKLAGSLRLCRIPALSITRLSNNTLASLCGDSLYIHSIPLPVSYGVDYEISTPYFILMELLFLKYQKFLGE